VNVGWLSSCQLLALRFNKDQRLTEVRRLLISSQPVRIAIPQRPEVRLALLCFLWLAHSCLKSRLFHKSFPP